MPGDAVRISVFPDSARLLSGTYPIDNNGMIDLPKIGLVKVNELSDSQLVALLKSAFMDYLRYPNLEVRSLIRVGMTGGYYQPGLLYADPRTNLWELIGRAGGTKRADGLEKIMWQRGDSVLSKKMLNPIVSGASLASLGVQTGDRFWVTDRLQRNGWEVFRDDVLPTAGFIVSAVTATVTVYLAYQAYKGSPNVAH
jgi:polysaccharide export outer membrane protein